MLFDDLTLNVIFGGVLYGLSVVLALKGNASTGGTDFIALYVSNKTGKSIWNYVFMGNVCILVIFGYMFGWKYAGYSILFQFISTKMISTFHHRYDRVTLQITTEKAEEIMKKYVSQYHHDTRHEGQFHIGFIRNACYHGALSQAHGKVSHKQAIAHANKIYKSFDARRKE